MSRANVRRLRNTLFACLTWVIAGDALAQATGIPAPVFSPGAGRYMTPQSISITDTDPRAVIHYTTNGTTPTTNSTEYAAPITLGTGTTTIQAVAAEALDAPVLVLSAVTTATYVLTQSSSATTLAVTSGGSPITTLAHGGVVTLTATVTSGSTPVTAGTVDFCDADATHCTDINLLGTAQLTTAGTATISFVPGTGSHSYKAVFVGGNASYGSSTSSASSLTVTGSFPTTTRLAQSGTAGNYTLTATVAAAGGSATLFPAGPLTILDTTDANFALGTPVLGASVTGVSFTNSSNPATTVLSSTLAVGDFNGDGKLDLAAVLVNYLPPYAGAVQIFIGNGDGTFTAGSLSTTGAVPYAVAVGDFNGDGKLDLAVTNTSSSTITILLGNGDGTFPAAGTSITLPEATGFAPVSIAVGDFNGDGKQDLAVTTNNGESDPIGYVTILLGNGDGTFTAEANGPIMSFVPDRVAIGDFNGDGKLDLAVTSETSVMIFLGNGDGTFTAQTNTLPTGADAINLVVGDFNLDGKLDLAVANEVNDTVTIFLGNGDGTFTQTPVSPATGGNPASLAIGDFNGDGKPDLALPVANGQLTVLLGKGDGTFTTTTTASNPAQQEFVTVGDFNGDGVSDIALAASSSGSDTVTALLTTLTETATAALSGVSPVGTGPHNIQASYPGNSNFGTSVSSGISLTALPVPTTLSLNSSVSSTPYGTLVTLTATLGPYTAENFTTAGEPVTFYEGSVIIGTSQISSGVATLSTSSLPVGSNRLMATYAGDVNFDPANSPVAAVSISTPVLSGIVPMSTTLGSANTTITATGLGFVGGAVVSYNGTPLATTYVDHDHLTAIIPASLLLSPGSETITVADPAGLAATGSQTFSVIAAPPVATASAADATLTAGNQSTVTLSVKPYPVGVTATATLIFTPAPPITVVDPTVLFTNNKMTTDPISIVPSTTTTVIPIQFQAGSTAGKITVTIRLTLAGGQDITPANLAPIEITVPPGPPNITSGTLVRSGNGLQVALLALSSTRDMTQAEFHFAAAPGKSLSTTDLTVPLTSAFQGWYQSSASDAYGTTFTYTQPFAISEDASDVQSVSVTLMNSAGTSESTTVQ